MSLSFWFGLVDPAEAQNVYQWHRGFACANPHISKRPWQEFAFLAQNWQIVAAKDNNGDYAAIAYFDYRGDCWVMGGLATACDHRYRGVGSVIAHIALGHMLFAEDPLSRNERIILHIANVNKKPMGVIEQLGFRYVKSVCGGNLPVINGSNNDKNNIKHEFELTVPDTLNVLINWCDNWNGKLKDGSLATIELQTEDMLRSWRKAFADMINKQS